MRYSWIFKDKRFLSLFGVGMCLLITSLIYFSETEEFELPTKKEGLPDFRFENIVISEFESGELAWEMNSEFANLYRDNQNSTLHQVEGKIYSKQREAIVFVAPEAKLNIDNALLNLKDVTATINFNDQATNLSASSLVWDGKNERIEGFGDIVVYSDIGELKGAHLIVSIPDKKFKLKSKAEAKYSVN